MNNDFEFQDELRQSENRSADTKPTKLIGSSNKFELSVESTNEETATQGNTFTDLTSLEIQCQTALLNLSQFYDAEKAIQYLKKSVNLEMLVNFFQDKNHIKMKEALATGRTKSAFMECFDTFYDDATFSVKTETDGNCFYLSVSLLLLGNEFYNIIKCGAMFHFLTNYDKMKTFLNYYDVKRRTIYNAFAQDGVYATPMCIFITAQYIKRGILSISCMKKDAKPALNIFYRCLMSSKMEAVNVFFKDSHFVPVFINEKFRSPPCILEFDFVNDQYEIDTSRRAKKQPGNKLKNLQKNLRNGSC